MELTFDGRLTIIGLEGQMRNCEAMRRKLTAIRAEGGKTVGTFEAGKVAKRSLALWVDPTGTATGPAGSTLICRGTAMVSGYEQPVAAFRKA